MVSLYIALPWLVQTVVKNLLIDQHIELKEMQLERPSWANFTSQTFQLHSLSLTLEDKTDITIREALIGMAGASTVVEIASITVGRGDDANNGDVLGEFNLLDLLPSVLFNGLPKAHVMVGSLLINQPDIEIKNLSVNLLARRLTANATINKGSFSGPFAPLHGAGIALNINAANELKFTVTAAGSTPLLELDLTLATRNQLLEGELQLNSSLSMFGLQMADGAVMAINDNQFISMTEFSLPAKQVLSADKMIHFLGHSKVRNTATITDDGEQQTQLIADTTVQFSLDKGQLRLSVLDSKKPLVQATGNIRRVVFPNNSASDDSVRLGVIGSLLATIKQAIIIDYDFQGEGLSMSGGEFGLEYAEQGERLISLTLSEMNLAVSETGVALNKSFQIKGYMDLLNIRNPLGLEKLSIGSLTGVVDSRIELERDQLTIKASSNNALSMRSIRFSEHAARVVSLRLPKQTFSVNLKTQNVSNVRFSLNGNGFNSADYSAKQFGVHSSVYLKNKHIHVRSASDAMEVKVSNETHYIPPMVINSKILFENLTANQASIKFTNACNEPIFDASWQPMKQVGHLIDMRWERGFSNDKTFRKWLNTSVLPFDVTDGVFTGHVVVELNDNKTRFRQLDVSLKGIQGIYEKGTFDGVQLQLSSPVQQSASNEMKKAAPFDTLYAQFKGTMKALNMGIKANNVVLEGAIYDHLNDWHVKTSLFKANVFSGVVEVRDEDININEDMQLAVMVNELDLSELVQTQEMDGLQTSGKLSGRIPIQYSKGQVNVLDGAMRSVGGGKIRYTTPLSQSADVNEQLKLTLDVLENFNYTALNSKIAYDDDTLFFKSAISGNNPDVANGRPINLNLNTEIALKGAIEAMRIQSGIDSKIEEFIGSKATTSTNQYYCQ